MEFYTSIHFITRLVQIYLFKNDKVMSFRPRQLTFLAFECHVELDASKPSQVH